MVRTRLVLVLAVSLLAARAVTASCPELESSFAQRPRMGVEYSVDDFTLADFNRDGILDAAGIRGFLRIATGTPFGAFQYSGSYVASGIALSITAADFDGDGWPDVALSTQRTNIQILLNRQDGTFALPREIATPFVSRAVRAADVDRDGITDLVVAGSTMEGGVVTALLGNGDATFRVMAPGHATTDGPRMVLGDFNGDGVPDVAVPGGILLSDGRGGFGAVLPFSPAMFFPAAGDLNGDGRADLAANDNGSIAIFLANADGSMQRVATLAHPATAMGIQDIDGDGLGELFLSQTQSVVIRAGANGDWSAPTVTNMPILGRAMHFADMNFDGTPDLISLRSEPRVHYNFCGRAGADLVPSRMSSFAGQELELSYNDFTTDGTVTFYAGETALGSDSQYPFEWTTTLATPGDYVLKAVHDSNGGATASVRHRVYSAPSTLSIDASAVRPDTDSTIVVRIQGPPDSPSYASTSGEVTLEFNGKPHRTAPVAGGVATFRTVQVSPGTFELRAIYTGGTLWAPGETTIMLEVAPKKPKGRAVRK